MPLVKMPMSKDRLQYQGLFRNNTLRSALFRFGSEKKNKQMLNMMRSNDIEEYRHKPFAFN